MYLSYRTLGYTANGSATITVSITLVEDGRVVLGGIPISGKQFTEVSPGTNERLEDYWFLFLNPNPLFGKQAKVGLTITDETVPSISTTIQQTVVIVNASE